MSNAQHRVRIEELEKNVQLQGAVLKGLAQSICVVDTKATDAQAENRWLKASLADLRTLMLQTKPKRSLWDRLFK